MLHVYSVLESMYTLLVYTKVNVKVNAKIKHQIKIKYKQVKKHNSDFIKLFQVKKTWQLNWFESIPKIDTLCMCNMLLSTLRLKTLSLMWEQSGKTPPISIARQSIGELYLKIKLTQTGKDIYLCQKRYI